MDYRKALKSYRKKLVKLQGFVSESLPPEVVAANVHSRPKTVGAPALAREIGNVDRMLLEQKVRQGFKEIRESLADSGAYSTNPSGVEAYLHRCQEDLKKNFG